MYKKSYRKQIKHKNELNKKLNGATELKKIKIL